MNVTILSYNQSQSLDEQAVCDLLFREIESVLSDANGKIWHAHPVWFLDSNPIVGYSKLKSGIRLLFWSGQSFKTPGLQPEGSFKAAGVQYTCKSQIDIPLLREWLEESREIQWDYKNIRKRKGRLERL